MVVWTSYLGWGFSNFGDFVILVYFDCLFVKVVNLGISTWVGFVVGWSV